MIEINFFSSSRMQAVQVKYGDHQKYICYEGQLTFRSFLDCGEWKMWLILHNNLWNNILGILIKLRVIGINSERSSKCWGYDIQLRMTFFFSTNEQHLSISLGTLFYLCSDQEILHSNLGLKSLWWIKDWSWWGGVWVSSKETRPWCAGDLFTPRPKSWWWVAY